MKKGTDWYDIPNVENYKINRNCEVLSCSREMFNGRTTFMSKDKIMNAVKDRGGYHTVAIRQNGIYKRFRIHQLMAKVFIPNPENLPQVNHKDGNKDNNSVENLEWVSQQRNIQHASETGLNSHGTSHYLSKLTEDQVREIRKTYKFRKQTAKMFAEKYGVSVESIYEVIKYETWKHVKD